MKEKRKLLTGVGLISVFALWTFLIQCVDVQPAGQVIMVSAIAFSAFMVIGVLIGRGRSLR